MSVRLRRALAVPLLALGFATATGSAPAQASHADPAVAGPHAVTYVEYDAGTVLVNDAVGVTFPEQLMGSIHIPSGTGPFPVVLFEHGRHETCAYFGFEFLGSPCPDTPATRNVRSYRGYDYLGQNLASNGYIVVSVNANAVNTYDTWDSLIGIDAGTEARAQVIAYTLDRISQWNTTNGPGQVGNKLIGKVDLSRLGLMGHSRGGEGVTRFIDYNRTRTNGPRYPGLKAVFALAPTDFTSLAPSDVHFATLLPLCDGDVSNLWGAYAYDRGRFVSPSTSFTRTQYTVNGANHNFYNTIWTGDDYANFGDPADTACSTTQAGNIRQSAADQRRTGLVLIGGFLRRWVGGETAFHGLVTGADALPSSACAGGTGSCPNLVRTSYLAPAANRLLVVTPNDGPSATTATATGGTLVATGLQTYSACTPPDAFSSTATCPTNPTRAAARQLTVGWNAPSSLRANISATGTNVTAFNALTFRTGVNYNDARNVGTAQNVGVVLRDALGGVSAVVPAASHTVSLNEPAGTVNRQLTLNGVRIQTSAFTGVDLTKITAIELRFGTLTASGSIQLAEIGFQST